ncbi:hypothetical protein Misp01_34080 [Microtetraspora sp. NBRC 13810]|uniref:DUF3224 domain-containing protein n=1 Tax=Microtetraspora sp. NBRC 13810 TaxID=3030990 RepID=UPI0024A339B4|nr:DUF3224 domain-containing protein [Microtetraspora sp. NBRC 13810]GLW08278.1 hypothetical protein Misp01_34080 [Microtetraspora sp. NBRC 13810]
MTRASGTFDINVWDAQEYDEREGAKLARVHITKTFHGGLTGTSTADIITAVAQGEKSMAYSGFERFTGSLDGREGTFVLCHFAGPSDGDGSLVWCVLPDSGTGELRGLRGAGGIVNDAGVHSWHLDYELA